MEAADRAARRMYEVMMEDPWKEGSLTLPKGWKNVEGIERFWGSSDGLGPLTNSDEWPKHSAGTNFPYFEVKG